MGEQMDEFYPPELEKGQGDKVKEKAWRMSHLLYHKFGFSPSKEG
jgi:hypothetical protein